MQARKPIASKKQIGLEIYKTFELFKAKKNITIADYLNKLDVTIFKTGSYRKIKFSYESLIKLVLFQRLKGIKFHTKLTKYLRKTPSIKWKLGFSKTPDRTTIGYFINKILDDRAKELIDYTIEKIIETSEKFNILFDINTLKPEKPERQTQQRNQQLIKNKETREICKLFKKRITPFINLKQHHNTKYSKNTLINLLVHLGLTQDFAENGSKIFRELKRKGPDADTLFYHLKKYDNIRDLQKMFISVFEVVCNMAQQANIINKRKQVDVAIDYTEWPYYGKPAKMVTGKKPERGTASCYKFATINIVEPGKRFTLLAVPVSPIDSRERILRTLISYALQRIRIKNVYLDRGFYDSLSLDTINRFHLKYLIPAIRSNTVKRLLEVTPASTVIESYPLRHIKINLVVLEDIDKNTGEKVKRVFATNIRFDENDVNLSDRLFFLYSKRWGIESSYRVKKHSFRGKTTSKTYIIRLFYFMFSVLLYNLWILADILLQLYLFGYVTGIHILTSKYFGTLLMIIDPGG